MVRGVKEWLLSIVMLSFLISLLRLFLPEGNLRKVGAFTGSLVLMAAILRPLVRLEPELPAWDMSAYESAIAERVEELDADFGARVAEKCAELIEAKAAELGAEVSAAVTVREENGTPLPQFVELYGERDAALSEWIRAELGIPPERQEWRDGGTFPPTI